MADFGTAPRKIRGVWYTAQGRRLSDAGQTYWEHHLQQGLVDPTGHRTRPQEVGGKPSLVLKPERVGPLRLQEPSHKDLALSQAASSGQVDPTRADVKAAVARQRAWQHYHGNKLGVGDITHAARSVAGTVEKYSDPRTYGHAAYSAIAGAKYAQDQQGAAESLKNQYTNPAARAQANKAAENIRKAEAAGTISKGEASRRVANLHLQGIKQSAFVPNPYELHGWGEKLIGGVAADIESMPAGLAFMGQHPGAAAKGVLGSYGEMVTHPIRQLKEHPDQTLFNLLPVYGGVGKLMGARAAVAAEGGGAATFAKGLFTRPPRETRTMSLGGVDLPIPEGAKPEHMAALKKAAEPVTVTRFSSRNPASAAIYRARDQIVMRRIEQGKEGPLGDVLGGVFSPSGAVGREVGRQGELRRAMAMAPANSYERFARGPQKLNAVEEKALEMSARRHHGEVFVRAHTNLRQAAIAKGKDAENAIMEAAASGNRDALATARAQLDHAALSIEHHGVHAGLAREAQAILDDPNHRIHDVINEGRSGINLREQQFGMSADEIHHALGKAHDEVLAAAEGRPSLAQQIRTTEAKIIGDEDTAHYENLKRYRERVRTLSERADERAGPYRLGRARPLSRSQAQTRLAELEAKHNALVDRAAERYKGSYPSDAAETSARNQARARYDLQQTGKTKSGETSTRAGGGFEQGRPITLAEEYRARAEADLDKLAESRPDDPHVQAYVAHRNELDALRQQVQETEPAVGERATVPGEFGKAERVQEPNVTYQQRKRLGEIESAGGAEARANLAQQIRSRLPAMEAELRRMLAKHNAPATDLLTERADWNRLLRLGNEAEGLVQTFASKLGKEGEVAGLEGVRAMVEDLTEQIKDVRGKPPDALVELRKNVTNMRTTLRKAEKPRSTVERGKFITPEGHFIEPIGSERAATLRSHLSVTNERIEAYEKGLAKRKETSDLAKQEAEALHQQAISLGKQAKDDGSFYLRSSTTTTLRPAGPAASRSFMGFGRPKDRKVYSLTGEAFRSGLYRTDHARIIADSMREGANHAIAAEQFPKFLALSKESEAAAGGKYATPIRTTENMTPEFREAMMRPPFGDETPEQARVRQDDYRRRAEEWRFPQKAEIDPATNTVAATGDKVRWVDRRLIGGLLQKERPGATRLGAADVALGSVFDTINAGPKLLTLLKPGYWTNRVQQLGNNLSQQGVFLKSTGNFVKTLHEGFSPAEFEQLKASAGIGKSRVLKPESGVGKRAISSTADFLGKWTDDASRLLAMAYELRIAGYDSVDKVRALLHSTDEAERADFEAMVSRARQEAIPFEKMSDIERKTIARVLFFYPWTRAALEWTARFPGEHPFQAAAYGQAGIYGKKELAKRGMGPLSGVTEWANTLLPFGLGRTLNLASLNTPQTVVDTGHLIQTVFAGGDPYQNTDTPASDIGPALAALYGGLSGTVRGKGRMPPWKAALMGMFGSTPEVQSWVRSHKPAGAVYPGGWEGIISPWLGGLYPRKTDQGALQADTGPVTEPGPTRHSNRGAGGRFIPAGHDSSLPSWAQPGAKPGASGAATTAPSSSVPTWKHQGSVPTFSQPKSGGGVPSPSQHSSLPSWAR